VLVDCRCCSEVVSFAFVFFFFFFKGEFVIVFIVAINCTPYTWE